MKTFVRGLFFNIVIAGMLFGSDPHMIPYKDSLIFLVHGINSNRYTWYQSDRLGKPDLVNGNSDIWLHYFNKNLRVDDKNIFPYSFSESSGYHGKNMLELGGIGYKSEASDPGAENNTNKIEAIGGQKIQGNTGISGQKTWIEQAVEEYKSSLILNKDINPIDPKLRIWNNIKDIPDVLLPSKLVMLAHSQGNVAVRGYIQSGALARQNDIRLRRYRMNCLEIR